MEDNKAGGKKSTPTNFNVDEIRGDNEVYWTEHEVGQKQKCLQRSVVYVSKIHTR